MSKATIFHPRLAAMTDQWMDLFGYLAPSVVTDTRAEWRACRGVDHRCLAVDTVCVYRRPSCYAGRAGRTA